MPEQFAELYSFYPAYSEMTLVFGLILGLVVGSFLNVVIGRLPVMMQRQWQRDCAGVNNAPEPTFETFNISTDRKSVV